MPNTHLRYGEHDFIVTDVVYTPAVPASGDSPPEGESIDFSGIFLVQDMYHTFNLADYARQSYLDGLTEALLQQYRE